jgi:HAD superfamily hydrolase (TIGR01459 family)
MFQEGHVPGEPCHSTSCGSSLEVVRHALRNNAREMQADPMTVAAPPILSNAGPLLAGYDVLFCDVWGVVHNGRTAYREGCLALSQFREQGGTVILVSNAPRTAVAVRRILDEKGVPGGICDAIVPSGDLARAYAAQRGFAYVHHIGPDRDLDVFDGSDLVRVGLEEAEAIFCTGLIRDRQETGEDYRAPLLPAVERGLPLICANPDLVVDVGGTLLPCAGAIATVYEDLGGEVFWAGKPFATAYQSAMEMAARLRGGPIEKSRILAIGDAVRTDIAGAVDYGIDALFIGQGIHRDAVMPNGELVAGPLANLFEGQPAAIAAMATLRW